MRLAHLILAHNNPLQLERLVKRLSTNRADVFMHLDKKSNLSEFKHLSSLPNVFFIANRTSIGWGNYSMVDATLKSFIEFALNSLNPRILTMDDAKVLIESGKFMARKFSLTQSPEILTFLNNSIEDNS